MMKYQGFEFEPKDLRELAIIFYKDGLHSVKSLCKKIKYVFYKKTSDELKIVLAIKTETKEEKNRVQNELYRGLRDFLDSARIPPIFRVILEEINEENQLVEREDAEKLLNKHKGAMIIYGHMSTREGNKYSFHLQYLASHGPIPEELSKQLAREMTELLPIKQSFPISDEIVKLEITSEWAGSAIEYLVGITSFLNGYNSLAIFLYKDLLRKLRNRLNLRESIGSINLILDRLPIRIFEACFKEIRLLYGKYRINRDRVYIEMMGQHFSDIESFPNSISLRPIYSDLKAMYQFLVKKDVDGAIKTIGENEWHQDDTWRYNLAFLYAYKGKLKKTKIHYQKAMKIIDPSIITDCEIFMTDVINSEPDKYELLFARGCLNFLCKVDVVLAREDLESFVKISRSKGKYEEHCILAETYLNQLVE